MSQYQEIVELKKILSGHKILIIDAQTHPNFSSTENIWLDITIDEYQCTLLVDDEFKDLKRKNPILDLCLVLRELETYQEEEDILAWAKFKGLSVTNNKVISYYKELDEHYKNIESILGKIDSQISDFDFEMNAGAIQQLRSSSNS
jgi:hypothetical protein